MVKKNFQGFNGFLWVGLGANLLGIRFLGRTSNRTQCEKDHSRLMNPLSDSANRKVKHAEGLLTELKSIRMHKDWDARLFQRGVSPCRQIR